jgi:hypothetical protein
MKMPPAKSNIITPANSASTTICPFGLRV